MLKQLGQKLTALGNKLQDEKLFVRKPKLADEIRRLERLIQEMRTERETKEEQEPLR